MSTDQLPPAANEPIRLLKVAEVLERLNVSRSTLYKIFEADQLPFRKIGNATRVRSDDLESFIKRLSAKQAGGRP